MLIKSLIAVAIGIAIGCSPYRDSKLVNLLIAITGGTGTSKGG
jgi:hypothetical protein